MGAANGMTNLRRKRSKMKKKRAARRVCKAKKSLNRAR